MSDDRGTPDGILVQDEEQGQNTPDGILVQNGGDRGGANNILVQSPSPTADGGAGDQPRQSADLLRRNKMTRNLGRDRYQGQAKQVSPGGFGANYDKAGLQPLKPQDAGPDKDLSKHAIAEPPSSWQNRVVDTIPAAQVNADDAGHTYHLLDDQTVVSTSKPATVDPATADKVNKKTEEKQEASGKKDPELQGIMDRLKAIQMKSKSWSTTADSREKIAAAEAEVKKLEEKIDRIRSKRKRKTPITPVKKELEKAKGRLKQVKAENSDPLKKKKQEKKGDDADGDGKKSVGQRIKDHTEVKGNIAEGKTNLWGKDDKGNSTMDVALLSEKHKDEPGMLGSTRTGETNLLHAGTSGDASFSVGAEGINANVTAEGKATLVDLQEKWEWKFPFKFLDEDVTANLFLMAKGMIGAEAKAQLSANVKGLNPKEPKINENAVMAGVDAFAGAKVQLGVGAALEWMKKPAKAYQAKLGQSAEAIIKLITVMNPPVGWVLSNLGGEEATRQVLEWLFDWGKQGKTPLVGIEAMGEASAGIGASAQAAIGLRGGKFEFQAKANATWGVGLGGKVKVMLDVIEGPKFAVLALGELMPIAEQFAKEQIDAAVAKGLDVANAIWDWLNADDKVREAVANGAHEVVGYKERGDMINTLMGGWCGDADEDAIVEILRASKRKGDLRRVLIWAPADDILWALDGAQDAEARRILGM